MAAVQRIRMRVFIWASLAMPLCFPAQVYAEGEPMELERSIEEVNREANDLFDRISRAERIELLSLDPFAEDYPRSWAVPIDRTRGFHGYKILGQLVVADPDRRTKIIAILRKGVADHGQRGGAGCFIPRHGIRGTRGDQVIDLLICFECTQFETYVNGKQGSTISIMGKESEPLFNEMLANARVPLPPPRKGK